MRWCEKGRDKDKNEEPTRVSLDMVARFMLLVWLLGIHRNKQNWGLEAGLTLKLDQVAQGAPRLLQGWRFHHFSVQAVPVQNVSPYQGCFSYFQPEFPLLELLATAPCPIVHLCEESGSVCCVTLLPAHSLGNGRLQFSFASSG